MNQSKMIAFYHYDQPSDLGERLSSRGFMVEEAEAIMVLNLENAPEIFGSRFTLILGRSSTRKN